MLDITDNTIRNHLQGGVLTYFGEELCLIEEIKGEEVDKFGKTSAFDRWFSTPQQVSNTIPGTKSAGE
jgi:hypothetical protein